jgi:tRNA (mo5U34)-methyltransferase
MALTQEEVRDGIRDLAPFHHAIDLPYGLSTHVPELAERDLERTRIANLVKHLWPALLATCGGTLKGKRVLDIACNCGGFSVEAVKSGAEQVLGIDIVDRYVEQAKFIRDALGYEQLDFRKMDVGDLDAADVGMFDVTFCFGILYHLEDPVGTMRKISAVTKSVIAVDTGLYRLPGKPGEDLLDRHAVWQMNFPPPEKSSTTNQWRHGAVCQLRPTAGAVVELLKFLGFSRVEFLEPKDQSLERRYLSRDRGTFIASR